MTPKHISELTDSAFKRLIQDNPDAALKYIQELRSDHAKLIKKIRVEQAEILTAIETVVNKELELSFDALTTLKSILRKHRR
jgi:hypothetical protein